MEVDERTPRLGLQKKVNLLSIVCLPFVLMPLLGSRSSSHSLYVGRTKRNEKERGKVAGGYIHHEDLPANCCWVWKADTGSRCVAEREERVKWRTPGVNQKKFSALPLMETCRLRQPSTHRSSSHGDGLPLEVHEVGLMAFKIHEAALVELGDEGGGLPVDVGLPHPHPSVLVAGSDLPGHVPRLPVGLLVLVLGLEEEKTGRRRRLASSHSLSFLFFHTLLFRALCEEVWGASAPFYSQGRPRASGSGGGGGGGR
ncbi:hypothetical protein B296_00009777 [Ensete ventricosum]|uniref:Uncharacterized protein n=1 Tax=Ensete ventricosum TaxID=4639 RepID=A0A426ZLA4_ENSVE|nr:hypothetical protein B296_00009777 [Ensete ventricosum]